MNNYLHALLASLVTTTFIVVSVGLAVNFKKANIIGKIIALPTIPVLLFFNIILFVTELFMKEDKRTAYCWESVSKSIVTKALKKIGWERIDADK